MPEIPETPEKPQQGPPLIEEGPKQRPTGAESTPGGVGAPLGTETYETRALPALDALLQTNFMEVLPSVKGLKDLQPHAESHEPLGDDYIMALGEVMFLDHYLREYTKAGMADAAGDVILFSLSVSNAKLEFGWGKAKRMGGRTFKESTEFPDAGLWDPVFMGITKSHTGTPAVQPDMDNSNVSNLYLKAHDITEVRRLEFEDTDESGGNDISLQQRGDAAGAILEIVNSNDATQYSSPTYRRLRLADPVGADDATTKRYVDALSYAGHTLLDASLHTDTLAAGVTDGSIVIGNVTPKWSELVISIPAANVRNVLGVDNGELRPSWKTALDVTNPVNAGGAASPGTSLVFSHRDHVHAVAASHSGSTHHAEYTDAMAILAVEGHDPLDLLGDVTIAADKWLTIKTDGNTGGLKLGAAGDWQIYRSAASEAVIPATDVLALEGTLAATDKLKTRVVADAASRFILNADGAMEWGDGALVADVSLYRVAAGELGLVAADTFSADTLKADILNERTPAAGVTIEGVKALDSFHEFDVIAAPGAPAANKLRLYAKDVGGVSRPYSVDSDGLESELAGFTLIASVTLGGIAETLADFQNIPAKFRNLRLVWSGASGAGSTAFRNIALRLNNDAGGNYHHQRVEDGTGATALSTNQSFPGRINGATAGHQTWGTVDILNYAGTTNDKGIVGISGYNKTGDIVNMTVSDMWLSSAAINRVTIFSDAATCTFAAGSVCYLYGY